MSAINFWDGTQWVTLNTTGATGAQGPRGDKGDTGAPGVDGAPGADGAPGQDGISINILGSVEDPVDLPATPNAGDAFIYADAASPLNGNLLVFTPGATGLDIGGSPSEWVVGGRIVGPAGADGAPGADGAEGPRGPNCYVQVAEPVGGGVGELWIDPDAVVADAEPSLPLKGGTMTGNVVFDTTRQTAGDNKEIVCRGGGVAGSPSSYWGLEVSPDDNANITYCVGAYVGKKAANQAAGLSGYAFLSDVDGADSYAFWARGTAPSRFVGAVQCAGDLTVVGNITAAKGAISGEVVGYPVLYDVTDQDHALVYDAAPAGRRERRLIFSSAAGNKVTVPTAASAAFPIGWEVAITNTSTTGTAGVNRCEIVAAPGVQVIWGEDSTLHSTSSGERLRVRNNLGFVRLTKVGANVWHATGDTIKI